MDSEQIKRSLEALLFAADTPLSLKVMKSLLDVKDVRQVKEAISALAEEYERRSFQLIFLAGGYQLYTRPEYVYLVKRLYRGRKLPKLSPQALEALAIVAYKQPVTRIEVERIRGVSVEGVLGTLLERRFIQAVGREKGLGRPILYGTTNEFLRHFQLRDLSDLPTPENAKAAKETAEDAENAKDAEEKQEMV